MGAGHRPKPKWLRSAERQGLVSAMNATKWREATEALRTLPGGPPRFRIKDIDAIELGDWDRDWHYHPRPYETIEWLEIDPDTRSEQIRAALIAVGVPVAESQSWLRITGWLRTPSPMP